jgi:2-dehydro-3-deoxy-D-gluconate 5-dehydrogenase
MDVNLKSVFFLSQAVAKRMLSRDSRGKIINIASLLSFSGRHSRVLVRRCEERSCGADEAPRLRMGDQGDRNAAILARIPAGHWGKPEEIGGPAVFLASAAADYVHGVVLPVDGGWLAR